MATLEQVFVIVGIVMTVGVLVLGICGLVFAWLEWRAEGAIEPEADASPYLHVVRSRRAYDWAEDERHERDAG